MAKSPALSSLNTSPEVTDSGVDAAVIPLGSVEGKGPHLPVGTDLILADAFAASYADEVGSVYVLPALPFGCSGSQRGFAGTVYWEPDTMWDALVDVVGSLHHGGFRRFTVLNLCSANWVVKPTVRELNLRMGLGRTVWVEPKQFAYDRFLEIDSSGDDRHGGAVETALMMHCLPASVGPPPADHVPSVGWEFVDYVGLRTVSETGVWGRPNQATAALGGELYEHMLTCTVTYVEAAFATWDAEGVR